MSLTVNGVQQACQPGDWALASNVLFEVHGTWMQAKVVRWGAAPVASFQDERWHTLQLAPLCSQILRA